MKKLKPVGILAIVVGIIFVLGTVALLGKYIWSATRSLESMGGVSIAHTPPSPALASVTKPAPPVPPPTLGPLPEGWRIERDPFTGDNYLAPSFEVEMAVIDAFEAVLSLEVIEDRSNEKALAHTRDAALSRAEELATTGVIESYRILTHVELGTLGPKNLVKCQDLDTCEIAQAKLGV
ncbi:MAG: hypothetical protein GY832_13775, partial [Chloroflexi bacterium]|nr:hypothetical protein [Chloroflexota bacterium]